MAPRDRWIGWSDPVRQRNLPLIVNHSRFLILPWVRIPHLASHILARVARQMPLDWLAAYRAQPVLLETLVDATRYHGGCYRAANWQVIGTTAGRGHRAPTFEQTRPGKQMLGLPLHRRVRELLSQ